jgi:hypothetical protein
MRVFDTREELIEYLKSADVSTAIQGWMSDPSWTWQDVVVKSIDGTTFRAFHTKRFGRRPSELYRDWGHAYFSKNISAFADADCADTYQQAIDAAVNSLQAAWPAERPVDYGRAAKLINLTLKHCLLLGELPAPTRQVLGSKLHVALDRYTLAPIARLARQFKLPDTPTMQSVRSRGHYLEIQEWVRCLCRDAEVDPMVFEFALFNLQRGAAAFPSPHASENAATAGRRPRPLPASDGAKASSPIKVAASQSTVWLAPDGSPAAIALPHTDPAARVTGLRRVENVQALKVFGASYRNAVFNGFVELADQGLSWESKRAGKSNRARVRIRWFHHIAARGYVNLTLDAFEFVDGYSGEVVDNLGR